MRKVARAVLVLYVFTIPWEYSLDLRAPFGNIARIAGLLLLLAGVTSTVLAGRFRNPEPLHWLTLALYLWFSCTYFWSIAPDTTLLKLRGFSQEFMIVWLAWDLVDTPGQLRWLCRAWVAGSWILALLTLADFVSANSVGGYQIRFAAFGQDPNDVARFLDLGFPLAALLVDERESRFVRILCLGYFPIGLMAVLLTASRSGLVTAIVAIAGCAILLTMRQPKAAAMGLFVAPIFVVFVWLSVPRETLERVSTIGEQIQYGDLNQRMNIWSAGWRGFVQAPLLGHGAGSFVTASGLAAIDTAHNTVLSIGVEGGVFALLIASGIVAVTIRSLMLVNSSLRIAFGTVLAVWMVSSLVGTVAESRLTWLLFGVVAIARRLSIEYSRDMDAEFPVTRRFCVVNLGESR